MLPRDPLNHAYSKPTSMLSSVGICAHFVIVWDHIVIINTTLTTKKHNPRRNILFHDSSKWIKAGLQANNWGRKNLMIDGPLIRKWFRIWGVGDLLEFSNDAMHYVMIEQWLVESLRMKWEDAKRTKLEYYIANVNIECWTQCKTRMTIDNI